MSEFTVGVGEVEALPQFAVSVERLHRSVAAGGEAYAHAEEGIAAASGGGGRER